MYKFTTLFLVVMSISAFSQSVDPLTGRAIVSIPLGSIKAYDLGVSVSLNHHGGALRVDEVAGNAGMGWNVGVGGYSITREVRGLPDDINTTTRKGWLYNSNASTIQGFSPSADDNLGVCSDETTDWNFLSGRGYANDTEPDIFYFSAPGISGKFVFGTDGLPKLIPFQDLSVTFASGNFIIETQTGLTYTFDQKRTTEKKTQRDFDRPMGQFRRFYYQYSDGVTYTSTWDLSLIKSQTTGVEVTYAYSEATENLLPDYRRILNPDAVTAASLYWVSERVTYSRLTNISLRSYDIDLSWANGVIEQVKISEVGSADELAFNFIYKTMESSVGDSPGWRPFLSQVFQQRECHFYPPYAFKYVGVDLAQSTVGVPWGTEFGQDHFGYYNGEHDNKNFPTVYYYAAESNGKRLRVTPLPSGTLTATVSSGTTPGSRNVSPAYAKIGALETIILPTGAITTYAYEGNTYWDSDTSEELPGPGIRVSTVSTTGGEYAFGDSSSPNTLKYHTQKRTYEYKNSDLGNTSGRLLYPPVFAFIDGSDIYRSPKDLGPGSVLVYSRTKVIETGAGSTVYSFYTSDVYPAGVSTVPKSKVARKSGTPCSAGSMKNGLYTFPYAPQKDLNYKQGLPRKVQTYDAAGKLVSQRSMAYIEPQSSAVIKGLMVEENSTPNYFYSTYEIPVTQSKILFKEIETTVADESSADSLWVTKQYTYNSFNRLTESTQTNKDGSVIKNFVTYADDYNVTSPTGDMAEALLRLQTTNRAAEVIETWRTLTPIGGNEKVTMAGLSLFKKSNPFTGAPTAVYQSLVLPQGSSFTPASMSGSSFVNDSDYFVSATYGYADGLLVTTEDISQIPSSVHYTINTGQPVAKFVNCKAEEALFYDFEYPTKFGLDGGQEYTNKVRTGNKSVILQGGGGGLTGSLHSRRNIVKGADKYRFGFWAYSSVNEQNISVTIITGPSERHSVTALYNTIGQWRYIEGYFDVPTETSEFGLEVMITTGSLVIDDFVALPANARFSSRTFLPLTGTTSETDDRGNSTITVYDDLGRPKETYDRNRNLIAYTGYNNRIPGAIDLKAGFKPNVSSYTKATPITFAAIPNVCVTGETYSWIFDPKFGSQSSASGQSVSKTFTNIGECTVTLAVSKTGYATQTYSEQICIAGTVDVDVTIAIDGGPPIKYQCDPVDSGDRSYSISSIKIGGESISIPDDIEYHWSVLDNNEIPVDFSGRAIDESISVVLPHKDYQVYCTVSFVIESVACGSIEVVAQGNKSFNYVSATTCP